MVPRVVRLGAGRGGAKWRGCPVARPCANVATRQRQCRARPDPRLLRTGCCRGGRSLHRGVAARIRPQRHSACASGLASGAVRVAAWRDGTCSGDLRGQHPTCGVPDLAHVHDDRLRIVPSTGLDCRLGRRRGTVGRGSSLCRRAVLQARHSLRQHAPRHGLCGRRRSRGAHEPSTGGRDATRRRQAAVGIRGRGPVFGNRGVLQRPVPRCR